MSNNAERIHSSPARFFRGGRGRALSVALTAPVCLSFACGVDEHLRDEQTGYVAMGGRVAPPPLAGSTGKSAGGGAGSPGSGGSVSGSGSGGGAGAAGTPNAGAGGSAVGGSAGAPGTGGSTAAAGGVPATGGTGGTMMGGAGTGGSAGTSSGITVDINGTMLPKENVVAFIHIGHSNMAGRSRTPQSSRAYFFTDVDLYAWMFHAPNVWEPAREPNTAGDSGNNAFGTTLGGPGTAIVKEAAALAPNHYFVSLGYGRGSALCSQFKKGGAFYNEYMEAPLALKGKVTFGAIFIMLGITERHGTDDDIQNYPSCINTLATDIRAALAEPNLPLLVTDYEMESTGAELSPTGSFAQKIIPRIQAIPSTVANSALIPTEGLGMEDDHHFDLEGQREWSQRGLQIMQEKGWFHWAP
jgi:hypothetical protein